MQQMQREKITQDSTYYFEGIIASLIDEARRASQKTGPNSNTASTARKSPKLKPICKYCGEIHKSEN